MKIFQSLIFTILCFVVIFFVGLSLVKLWPKRLAIRNEVKNLEQKIAENEKINSGLTGLLDYFKSDSYREREARSRLNYKKPGEEVVFIFREKSDGKVEEVEIQKNLSNIEKWWKWLFNK